MDCMGGHINPLQLVDSIPQGMAIPRLRDRLCTIIADFRTQQALREACNVILQHDCLRLAQVWRRSRVQAHLLTLIQCGAADQMSALSASQVIALR